MEGSKLKRNVLTIIEEGIHINIYQKIVPIIDQDLSEACSKMMTLYELVQQLEAINILFPDMICPTYTIKLVKLNHNANHGGPYQHKYFDVSNEYQDYVGPSNLNKIIEGVRYTIDALNERDPCLALDYNVQGCNILCLTKKKRRNNNRKRLSKSIRHEVFKRNNYKCVECGATKEDIRLHIDHILPVSQGGSDELDNLQTLCETCNLGKSNRRWKT